MSQHLHTVTITGAKADPVIEFACVGDRDSDCHRWPDCDCVEYWDYSRDAECEHAEVPHDHCWMRPWFAAGDTEPSAESLTDAEYHVGMSGPISATTCEDSCCVEWAFIDQTEVK